MAVAWATGGVGADLIGGTVTTTTAAGVTTATIVTTTAGMMANAAYTSWATQASITLVNNKGDIEISALALCRQDPLNLLRYPAAQPQARITIPLLELPRANV